MPYIERSLARCCSNNRNVCIWRLPDDIFCKAAPPPRWLRRSGSPPAFRRSTPAHAQSGAGELAWRHALSLFGDVKYPADFKRFDYVNPDAPKGGVARQILIGTFDNFNIVVAGVKGSLAAAVRLIYETLMTPSLDEVSTEYGVLAEAVSHPDDFSSVTYRLRPQAKWHDGKPVTPDDVIFSLDAFKKYHPQYSAYYRHVVKAEKVGERDVKFTFDAPGNRELPQIVGQLTVLPKHWWEGTDSEGRKRDISATTLEKPLGSGAYRIKEFVAGRSVDAGAGEGLLGRAISASMSAATISTSCATSISATRRWRSRRSRATRSTGAPRTAPRTGRRPTISRRSPKSACCRRNSRTAAPASCRRSRSTSAATSSAIRGCAAR